MSQKPTGNMGHFKTSLVGWVRISAYKLRFGGIFQSNNLFCFPSHLGFFSEPPFITRGGNSLAADSGSASRVSESGSRIRNPSCANIWPSSLLNKQVSFVPELGFQSWPGSNVYFLLLFSAYMAGLIGAKQRLQLLLSGNWLCCLFLPWEP